ncbi:hypothetical protein GH714_004977 [Hevea brasiliensis]|uniref:Membralin n=1 Tax=Hevea brasiliensis TaxID=3981 RepID=A0A6A6L0W0_HEVBR|nr:hypothetical protein GH714_004977 [Hevea brasiliensis]
MDPEQTFIRLQERFSQMLTPKVRAALEYMYLFIAVTLFCVLVVMHANYVQQKPNSDNQCRLWSHNESESNIADVPGVETVSDKLTLLNVDEDGLTFLAPEFWLNWIRLSAKKGKLALKFWKTDSENLGYQHGSSASSDSSKPMVDDDVTKTDKVEARSSFPISAKETFKAAIIHFGKKWHGRLSFIWRHAVQIIRSFQKLWNITGIHLNLDVPKWMRILYLDRLNTYAVQWLEKKSKAFEPTYLYTMEKGYFLLPEDAKSRHNIRTVNITISARHPCFGNRLGACMSTQKVTENSMSERGANTHVIFIIFKKEFYNLSYPQQPPEGPAKFGDYLVTKCGVLMMSLFVFFTTTMSVSFTLRETQTRMLKFTVQLQHHARHQLPTFQLIFVHVIESLVFVPTVTAATTPRLHITSSTILASTLHITRLNTRNEGPVNTDLASGPGFRPVSDQAVRANGLEPPGPQQRIGNDNLRRLGNTMQIPGQTDLRQPETGSSPGSMNSFSSLLLWILGGASSEGLNSLFSMFRDVREPGQVYADSPRAENRANQDVQ